MVVHGQDGLDEITLSSETTISELKDNQVETYIFKPEEVGLSRCHLSELKGGDAVENAGIIRDLLSGKDGPKRDVAVLNAAAALTVGGLAKDMADGVKLAAAAVDDGRALSKMEALVNLTSAVEK